MFFMNINQLIQNFIAHTETMRIQGNNEEEQLEDFHYQLPRLIIELQLIKAV